MKPLSDRKLYVDILSPPDVFIRCSDGWGIANMVRTDKAGDPVENARFLVGAAKLVQPLKELRALLESGRITMTSDVPTNLEYSNLVFEIGVHLDKMPGGKL